jgi:hypothetical protein
VFAVLEGLGLLWRERSFFVARRTVWVVRAFAVFEGLGLLWREWSFWLLVE